MYSKAPNMMGGGTAKQQHKFYSVNFSVAYHHLSHHAVSRYRTCMVVQCGGTDILLYIWLSVRKTR